MTWREETIGDCRLIMPIAAKCCRRIADAMRHDLA